MALCSTFLPYLNQAKAITETDIAKQNIKIAYEGIRNLSQVRSVQIKPSQESYYVKVAIACNSISANSNFSEDARKKCFYIQSLLWCYSASTNVIYTKSLRRNDFNQLFSGANNIELIRYLNCLAGYRALNVSVLRLPNMQNEFSSALKVLSGELARLNAITGPAAKKNIDIPMDDFEEPHVS